MEDLKIKRRTAKANFTRKAKALNFQLDESRSSTEVDDAFNDFRKAYTDMTKVHEDYTATIKDDDLFAEQDVWLDKCQEEFLKMKIKVKDYCKQPESPSQADVPEDVLDVENEDDDSVNVSTESQPTPSPTGRPCSFKMEKPKMPRFGGDVREYHSFRGDFLHMIEGRYTQRDRISLLRTCLSGKPLEMIRGIGQDFDAALEYLDSVYGDTRFIADAIVHDVNSFKALRNGEDARFCDLVHLIRRSYNTLKEVKRPQDMDNSQMLALIERKMGSDDRKVWFRHLEQEKKPASLSLLIDWMTGEMKSRMRATAPVRSETADKGRVHHLSIKGDAQTQQRPFYRCWLCESSDHWTDQCKKFIAMAQPNRLKLAMENHVCFSCLKKAGRDHRMTTCKKKKQCSESRGGIQCRYYHHPLLHDEARDNAVGSNIAFIEGQDALLPVVKAEFVGSQQRNREGNILLDTGSQISIIRQSVADELKLSGRNISVSITKVGGEQEEVTTKVYKVPIRSMDSQQRYTVSAIGLPCISDEVTEASLTDEAKQLGLDVRELHRGGGPVDLLVGIDHPKMHIGETRQGVSCAARKSPLGWVVFGAANTPSRLTHRVLHVQAAVTELSEFWSTEAMGVEAPGCQCNPTKMTKVETEEYEVIKKSCKKVGSQWMVSYPWKRDPNELPDNKSQAERMLFHTEKKLAKDEDNANAYKQQMKEMLDLNFARQLTQDEMKLYDGPVHYIGHHAITRPEKKSTPLRIVFNSSAVFQGHSLNDYWMKGPDLLRDLFGVLVRFRERPVGVCGDISKMYHRVLIPEIDQHVHRFLWRNMQTDKEPDVFMKTVVTFGDKPAPAMAQIALKRTAEEGKKDHPQASRVIEQDIYMDDICTSVMTEDEASLLTQDIDEVLSGGGFKVKEWMSNAALRGKTSEANKEIRMVENQSDEKVLGTVWNQREDEFSYRVKPEVHPLLSAAQMWTKRKILSRIAGIFDPIGFAAAFLIKAKIGMQRLWEKGVGWDEELPVEVSSEWERLFQEMKALNDVSFQRSLSPPQFQGNPMLCIFCDASEMAFGACVYLRWELGDNEYDVRFVAAKSRVAPLKRLTLPRLELQGAVMAARLYTAINEEMTLDVDSVVFLTDSMIVLGWIHSQARKFKSFVSTRVSEIQTKSDPSSWRHVPGDSNPADDLSRGIEPTKLMERWRTGPEFLYSPVEMWPETDITAEGNTEDRERRRDHQVAMVEVDADCIDSEKYSKWTKLIRVTAYVQRFVRNLKAKCNKTPIEDEPLPESRQILPKELEDAESFWVRKAQKPLHDRLKKGEFATLSPYIDEGIIRVGGRAGGDVVSYEQRHPVLLPHQCQIAKLIVRYLHEQGGHGGVASTSAMVRQKYWILGVQRIAKTVKFRCVVCRKAEHKVETQLMADLPPHRVAPFTPPFHYTACDYFGPYHVRVGRNKTTKHYGVIFTCMNTRAVHLDVAVDCSTMEFLQVLRRFLAIRGQPAVIYSDNGTQFIGAEKELRLMVQGWSEDELREFCAAKGMDWKFVTPSAPHQNGCAESLVKSCKFALRKAIGDQVLKPFELLTCLTEVANLVNQRPIGRMPNDPDDGSYLSPNDMLLGRASTAVPQGPFRETPNPRHRVEFVQKIVDSFWKIWIRDVFPLLVPRRKWNVEKRNVRVDDVVMLSDPNAVRGKWTLGRVVHVYPGSDGRIRNVRVKTVDKEYRRPVTKVVVIFPAEGYDD